MEGSALLEDDMPLDLTMKPLLSSPWKAADFEDIQALDLSIKPSSSSRFGLEAPQSIGPKVIPPAQSVSRSLVKSASDPHPTEYVLCCKKCSHTATDVMELGRHNCSNMLNVGVSNESAISLPSSKGIPSYCCCYCGWQCPLNQRAGFNDHLRSHLHHPGLQSHKCAYCHKVCSDHKSLMEHLIAHPFLNCFVCSLCSMAFKTEGMAMDHKSEVHLNQTTNKFSHTYISQHVPVPSSPEVEQITKGQTRKSEGIRLHAIIPTKKIKMGDQRRTGFGHSLASEIKAAMARELTGVNTPTVSDLIFMKAESEDEAKGGDASLSKDTSLNLMSMLDKVVEDTLRTANAKPQKPSLKFTVTFSDDDDDGAVECDSTKDIPEAIDNI